MGIKEYLDKSLNKYFIETLNKNGFKLIKSSISGIGGIYCFNNSSLNFEIVNDRGIIETRISSTFSKYFYDFDLINTYLNRRSKSNEGKANFGKYDLSKRLNLEQKRELFGSHLSELETMFNELNYIQTEFELNKIGNE